MLNNIALFLMTSFLRWRYGEARVRNMEQITELFDAKFIGKVNVIIFEAHHKWVREKGLNSRAHALLRSLRKTAERIIRQWYRKVKVENFLEELLIAVHGHTPENRVKIIGKRLAPHFVQGEERLRLSVATAVALY